MAVLGGTLGCALGVTCCTAAPAKLIASGTADPKLSIVDETELRKRWPGQLANVEFSVPAMRSLRDAYLSSGNPFPRYLWADRVAECASTYLVWTEEGRAYGYLVSARWQEEGREYRQIHKLSIVDGELEESTSYEIQTLDEELFWSKVSGVAFGDGGSRVLGEFSAREADVMLFAGVSARVRFRCDKEDCTRCSIRPYVAQLRQLPWPFETPSPDRVPGIHADAWVRKCGRQLPERDALLVKAAESAKAVQLRTEIRPAALYSSRLSCQKDARPIDPKDIAIEKLPPFYRVRSWRESGTPRGIQMVSKERYLTAEQTSALLALFSEKAVFTGRWPSDWGTFDLLRFDLLDSEDHLIENGSATVWFNCSMAEHSHFAAQELSELGKTRCERLLELLGKFNLERYHD